MQQTKSDEPARILAWLKERPSATELSARFPAEWADVEAELHAALSERDQGRLQGLLHPNAPAGSVARRDLQVHARMAVRQRMAALAIERYSLMAATGRTSGRLRFNLFNGWLAQRLLFRRDFERKPVPLFWFRILWPLVWQKRLLMPLVERKGIYCFYSDRLVRQLADLIGSRRSIEIAAGDGTLSRFLRDRGVTITASDNQSWRDRIAFPRDVEKMDAIGALRKHSAQVVVCSWPPARNDFEREVFRTNSVETYIVISSIHAFASGNSEDYLAQEEFVMTRRPDLAQLVLPPELGCEVTVFERIRRA